MHPIQLDVDEAADGLDADLHDIVRCDAEADDIVVVGVTTGVAAALPTTLAVHLKVGRGGMILWISAFLSFSSRLLLGSTAGPDGWH